MELSLQPQLQIQLFGASGISPAAGLVAGAHPVVVLRRLLPLRRRHRVMDDEERRRRRRPAGAVRHQVLRVVLAVLHLGDPPVHRLKATLQSIYMQNDSWPAVGTPALANGTCC
ncbi:unnamed protein product [Alopecurus aequalis]